MAWAENKKMLLIGIGTLSIAGVLYFAAQQFPLDDELATGTIVPAERYRGEQISREDIKLGDKELSLLMQTDTFR
ncbi:MAG: hypothetical protein IIB71_15480, partial [Proteobacteria bacterium]|nr:hypothetical protein [Pseudomonadota bacterium]